MKTDKEEKLVVMDIELNTGCEMSGFDMLTDTKPTIIITFGENNMPSIELQNWGSINAMMIERAMYEVHRASHRHRAGELHKQNVENLKKENENV